MIFKIASKVTIPNRAPFSTSDPDELKVWASAGAQIAIGEIRVYKLKDAIPRGGRIRGAYKTTNPAHCKVLMQVGSLDFNPQDAVDEGIFTAGEMKKMGWDVIAPPDAKPEDVEVKEPVVEALPDPLPDFDTMTKENLANWAGEQDPPIYIDRRKKKSDMADDARAAIAERNK